MASPLTSAASDALDLVQRARAGDREAFAELVLLHQRPVRAYLARLLHDSHAADDLAQETFLVAYQRMLDYQGTGEFLSWLLAIARHKALSHLRSLSRARRRDESRFEQLLAQRQLAVAELDSADADHEARRWTALQGCVEQLAPTSRALVDAHYFQGRTAQAIADATQRQASTVRMALLRIRLVLQRCLRGKITHEEAP
jgi:RNA polymerase sigma-70 factor (ECF subfamily)